MECGPKACRRQLQTCHRLTLLHDTLFRTRASSVTRPRFWTVPDLIECIYLDPPMHLVGGN